MSLLNGLILTTGHIKETLLYSYKEKIDYIIIKGKSNGLKRKPKDTILSTPKCLIDGNAK